MRRLLVITFICLAAQSVRAQSLFTERGESGRLLLGGIDHTEDTDSWLAYYGLSVNGEVDLGLQLNRTSFAGGRTAMGIMPGAQLFLTDLGEEGMIKISATFAYEIGKMSGGKEQIFSNTEDIFIELPDATYSGFVGTGRIYLKARPDGKVYFYGGISYVWLQIKTDHGDWTQTVRGQMEPIHFGVAAKLANSLVADARIERTSEFESYLITLGWLY